MLKNYVVVALRNLQRRKGYAFLNVAGLAVGVASCMLILLFIRAELSYDRFHAQAERIVRLTASTSDDGQPTNANGAFSVGPALQETFPEVERVVRFVKMGWGEKRVVAHEDRRFAESRFFFADSTVFDVFTFPFVSGTADGALDAPYEIVLTESTARKYFGDADPIGQTLAIDAYNDGQFEDYTVTGVLADVPATSHIQFDFLASFTSQRGRTEGWGFDPVFTYLLLAPDADTEALAAQFPEFMERHVGTDWWYTLHLQPLLDIRLHSNLRAELEPTSDIRYVYLFSAIAVFVLLLACINFMNLATAQSARRAKEVGMRKVMGARRGQLVRQFLSEAVLLSLGATVLAFALVPLLLPLFNEVAAQQVRATDLLTPSLLGGVFGLALVVGLVAGSYPALFLSGFLPARVLKGTVARGGGAGLRQGLVVFQFAVSIALLAGTAIVYHQMTHLRALNLGFEKEQIVVLPLNDEIRQRYDAAEAAFLGDPRVHDMTATEQVPARAGNGAYYQIEGQDEGVGSTRLFVNEAFNRTYGIDLVAGQDFAERRDTDAGTAFVVNEAFAKANGWTPTEIVGRGVQMGWNDSLYAGQIVGVAEDFQLFSLRQGVSPVVMNLMPLTNLNFLSVRIEPGRVDETLAHLRQSWATFAPSYPFDYYFLDQDFERLHQADRRLGQIVGLFTTLAVLVACLGLFGLAAYTVEQRTKEIGVRKVLGAGVPGLVLLLSRDFVKLVLVGFVLAAPLAWWAMSRWLDGFAYRVDLGAGVFALAGTLALAIALATVSVQAVRAATMDPVRALRHE